MKFTVRWRRVKHILKSEKNQMRKKKTKNEKPKTEMLEIGERHPSGQIK